MQQLISLLLMPLGIGILYLGIKGIFKTRDFLKHAIETDGTVVEIEENTTDEGTYYYPIVSFRAGKNHFTFKSEIGLGERGAFRQGQNLKILYDYRQPDNAKVKSFIEIWASSFIPIALGASLIFFSTFLIIEN